MTARGESVDGGLRRIALEAMEAAMAKIPTKTVSFRVPAAWLPLIKALIEASPLCQNAVLQALQQHCDNRDAITLEQSFAALATGDSTRFKPTTLFPKGSPNNETISNAQVKALVKDVRRDLETFKEELRKEKTR